MLADVSLIGECFIAADIRCSPPFLLIGSYLCPSDPIDQQLGSLREILTDHENGYVIIMGDLNCMIGSCENLVPTEIPISSALKRTRSTKDKVANMRGKELIETLTVEGLLTLNGRTISDPLGEFTFLSPIGRSMVDLAISSISLAPFIIDGGMLQLSS